MRSALILVFTLAALYDAVPWATGDVIVVDIIGGVRDSSLRNGNAIPSRPFRDYNSATTASPSPNTASPSPKTPPPPPIKDIARYARYIVHYTDWTSLGHISHQSKTSWFPSSRVFSIADGPIGNSTGTPYIYTSFHDSVPRDLKIDPRCSMTMSLAETDFCKNKQYDPEDPRCSQVILTGYFIIMKNNTDEYSFAENALFSRHPEMKSWPKSHSFFIGKLKINTIQLVNNIGGSKYPNVTDYYNSPPPMSEANIFQRETSYEELEKREFDEFVDVNMVR